MQVLLPLMLLESLWGMFVGDGGVFLGGFRTGKGVGSFVVLGRCRCLTIYLFRIVNTLVPHSCLP